MCSLCRPFLSADTAEPDAVPAPKLCLVWEREADTEVPPPEVSHVQARNPQEGWTEGFLEERAMLMLMVAPKALYCEHPHNPPFIHKRISSHWSEWWGWECSLGV